MGSLMAGWASPVKDPKDAIYQRNKSLTRMEVDAYWKSKKADEEHLRDISSAALNQNKENIYQGSGASMQRSISLPTGDRNERVTNKSSSPNTESFDKANQWWRSSSWAFLNEPPVLATEVPSYKYASQFHITDSNSRQSKVFDCKKKSSRLLV